MNIRNRISSLAFIAAAVILSTAASIFVSSKSTVFRMGPFYNSTLAYDTAAGGQVGGEVRNYKNGVDTLIVGDVVYISANNKVRKSTTLALYNTIAGVVVGGSFTSNRAVTSVPVATDTAALANGTALVMSCGRAYVRIDAAAGIAPGLALQPSATVAGKVMARAASLDSLSRTVGRLVDSGIVSTSVLANVCIR